MIRPEPTDDELLGRVLRKMIASRDETWGCWIHVDGDSFGVDGSIENLPPEETQALERAYKETIHG